MKRKSSVSLVLMIIITMATQVLTLMKSSVVASIFGATAELDAFNLANNIVSFLFGLVAAGVSTIIIPEYTGKKNHKAVNTFITVVYAVVFAVISMMIFFRIQLIDAVSNRDELFVYTAGSLLSVLLLAQTLASVANITVAYFQCEGFYNIPKIISFFSHLLVITLLYCAKWYNKDISVMQYTMIVAAGLVFNFVIDTAVALKKGWRYKPSFTFGLETVDLFKRFLPIIPSTGVYHLSQMIDSIITARLETGRVTILSYSSQISSMVNTAIVGNLLMYIYPRIAKNIKSDDSQAMFWRQSEFIHLVVCLMVAGFVAIGKEAVLLLFHYGEFTYEASVSVFYGAAIYIFAQQASVVRNMIYYYFYSIGDTKTPATNGILVSIINIGVSIVLAHFIGFYGVIVGTAIAAIFSMIIMCRFKQKIGYRVNPWSIIGRYFANLAIMTVTIAVVLVTKWLIPIATPLLSIAVFGVETVLLYVVAQLVLNRKVIMAYRLL